MFVRGESCVAHVIVEVLFRLVHHHTHRAGGAHAARHGRRRQEERRGSEHEWQHIYAEGISTSSVWGVASSEVFLREMRELAELVHAGTCIAIGRRRMPSALGPSAAPAPDFGLPRRWVYGSHRHGKIIYQISQLRTPVRSHSQPHIHPWAVVVVPPIPPRVGRYGVRYPDCPGVITRCQTHRPTPRTAMHARARSV